MFSDLMRAAVGAVIETPAAIVADVVTLGGTLSDEPEPYTVSALRDVKRNLENATEPRK